LGHGLARVHEQVHGSSRLIGQGGMGEVYEAAHLRVPRRFAVKILRAQVAADRQVFERYEKALLLASLGIQARR
jgi:serine/threonine-protein kinase